MMKEAKKEDSQQSENLTDIVKFTKFAKQNTLKNVLQNLISGTGRFGNKGKRNLIQTVSDYLRTNEGSGSKATPRKRTKQEEEINLRVFVKEHKLEYTFPLSVENLVDTQGEHTVYSSEDGKSIIKINSLNYYNSYTDYFHNLLIHNFFFPDTAYILVGFVVNEGVMMPVVKQNFVRTNEIPVSSETISAFLAEFGFIENRKSDFINEEFGIILEDLHDENVIQTEGKLFFIDTVFYLTDKFWE
jgi:hypothetical protein